MASLVIDQYLRCAVCMDFFHDPHRLPCGHSFCRRCIEGVRQHCLSFQCPECRQTVYLDGRGLDCLEKERRFGAMVTEFKQQLQESRVCKEHQKTVEGYCETCRLLLCGKCFFSKSHKDHVMGDVEEVASRKKEELLELMKMEKVQTEARMEEERKLKEQIAETREQIKDEFQEMYQHLKKKEESLLQQLDHVAAASTRPDAADQEKARPLSEADLSDDSVAIVQIYLQLKERIQGNIDRSRPSQTPATVPQFHCPNIHEFIKNIKLQDSLVRSVPLTSSRTENMRRDDMPNKTSLHSRCSLSPASPVQAATFLSSGHLVLLGMTSNLQLYDERGKLRHQMPLEDKAYDITAINQNTLVVTTGSSKRLLLISATERQFEITKSVEIDTECFNVTSVDDKLVTANGSLASFFNIDGRRHKTIIMPGMIQYLGAAKLHRKIFLNIRSEYVMRTDLKGTKEFKYKSEDLKDVTGLTVDQRCHAFICGGGSRNVHHIDDKGTLVCVILSESDGIVSPLLVGINSTASKLFLVHRNEKLTEETVILYDVNKLSKDKVKSEK